MCRWIVIASVGSPGATQPYIRQFFVGATDGSGDVDALERKLYVLRRVIENAVAKETDAGDRFYICSLSAQMIVYKGLLLAPQLLTVLFRPR